ncbi:MAG: pimeloyl-ACP methyl ester carboxylesterase [Pseudohongiellaceae bacterium]
MSSSLFEKITGNNQKGKGVVQPRIGVANSISSKGFHKLIYREWGEPFVPGVSEDTIPVICLHGLTRNSRDFDQLAEVFASTRRVICPDTVGRGHSDWLRTHDDYNLPQYNLDVAVIAARTRAVHYDIIGTSLGGLMGIILASMDRSPIRRLVINDIAPEIPMAALQRLSHYLGENPLFTDLGQVETYIREKYSSFKPMNDDNWKAMAENSALKSEEGYRLTYDPAIAKNYHRYWLLMHFNVWNYWKSITCPVLVIRGTESDFLTPSLVNKMKQTLPHAEFIEFEGVGHTPTLNAKEQIDPILEWLNRE